MDPDFMNHGVLPCHSIVYCS